MVATAKQLTDLTPAGGSTLTVSRSASSSLWVWLVMVLLVVLYAPTMVWLWGRWTLNVWQDAYGLMILPVAVYLIWEQLRENKHLPRGSSAWGFAILVPALILQVLDTGMNTQLLSAFSLILMLPGLSLLFLGVPRTRCILFPLLFLFFTLPIPLAFTGPIHLFLREIVMVAMVEIIPRIGIPLYVEGFLLQTPNGYLLVSDACSGFSTLYAALAIACLVAYMCPDWRRRILVLVLAAPLAIAANIARIVFLTQMVDWYSLGILDTPWHTGSGLATFAIVLSIIFWLGHTRGTVTGRGQSGNAESP